MQPRHVPAVDPGYWVAISIASVFGANLGDFVSHDLHLGHWRGLVPLGLILAGVLWQERRASQSTPFYYWSAIVLVRTMATNLADLATHDLRLGYAATIAALAILLAVALRRDRALPRADPDKGGLPPVTPRYWAAMLIAGTLGTALGDGIAGGLGLGVGLATCLLCPVLAMAFVLRARSGAMIGIFYWITIVTIRTTGTTLGDLLADTIGLQASTLLTGALLLATVMLSRRRRPAWSNIA